MEQQLISARVEDAVRLCDNSSFPKFIGFLTPTEATIAKRQLGKLSCCYTLYGGYGAAERVYLGVFPSWCEEKESFFPITSITFRYRDCDKLTHRDFLGALMSLGINRETVGDILIENGRAVVFLSSDIAEFVVSQVEKIGKVGVKTQKGHIMPLPQLSIKEDISDTIASPRLDCVVAALAKCSRSTAEGLILGSLVSVNSVCVEKTIKAVFEGDKITIRGKGKFEIVSLTDKTKKKRVILIARKYV